MDHAALAELWLWLTALTLAAVVILDGFDLGLGILCLAEKDEHKRLAMMASIEGVWHANQTWLVIAGGVLFGAFPKAYGVLLGSLYLPAGVMLLGLMARGVGLEYHGQAENTRPWSNLFGLGSLVTALAQGAMLGAVMQGLPLTGPQHFLTPFAWMTSGALLGALALTCAMGLLGAGWAKVYVQDFSQRDAVLLFALGSLVFQAGLLAVAPAFWEQAWPIGVAAAVFLLWALAAVASGKGFFLPAGLHVLASLVAWLVALRPGFTEPGLTPLTASAAPGSLVIMLWGSGIALPVIICYTIYQYRVFKGQGAYASEQDQ